MTLNTWNVRILAGGLMLACAATASAQPARKKKAEVKVEAKVDENATPTTKARIKLEPEGVKWGMTQADLESVVDGFIDASAKKEYERAVSGPALRDLETRVSQQKSGFRRTKVDLVVAPTGLDQSPIAPEFSKGNGELLMRHDHAPGQRIWFFFIGGRLWKTLEEVNLVDKGPYGKDIGDAAKKIVDSVGGTMPRAVAADPAKGQYYDVVDWQDGTTHLRVWDRGGTVMIVREDKSIVGNLPNLRKNKVGGQAALDSQVAAALRAPDPPPPPEKPPTPPPRR